MRNVHYPHPSLKHAGKPIGLIDRQLRLWAGEMFELMYDDKGLGLAAPQVALPFQLLVMNVEGKAGEKEHERVYINPRIVERIVRGAACGDRAATIPDLSRPNTLYCVMCHLRRACHNLLVQDGLEPA